jgi:hypothetical protein
MIALLFTVLCAGIFAQKKGKSVSENGFFGTAADNGITITSYEGTAKNVVIPEKIAGIPVVRIEAAAFYDIELTGVVIPNTVISIGDSAFANNNLTNIIIPNSVTRMGGGVFANNNLSSVVISDSITKILGNTFANNQLKEVVIPNSVTEINASAFQSNMVSAVTIPNKVKFIGERAFTNNPLTSVTFLGKIKSSGFNAETTRAFGIDASYIVDIASFPGDLRDKFYAADKIEGTPGTYLRPNGTSSVWTLKK